MTPRDVTPVDVVRMPLVMEVISLRGRIVHHSTWIVEPSCRCGEVVARAPPCEESVVGQALDDIGSQYSWDLLRADGGEAAKRNAQERKRSKHDELADRYSNPTAAM